MTPSVLWDIVLWSLTALVVVCLIILIRKQSKSEDLSLASKAAMPSLNNDVVVTTEVGPDGVKPKKPAGPPGGRSFPKKVSTFKAKPYSRESLESFLSLAAIVGDFCSIAFGFVLADLLCRTHIFPFWMQNLPVPSLPHCYQLILLGSAIVLWGLTGSGLYAYKSLVFVSKTWHKFVGPIALYFTGFIITTQMVRTDPPIPCIFLICSAFFVFFNICSWRYVLTLFIQIPALASRLRRRVVVIGGGAQTARIQKALSENTDMEFIGWVQAIKPNHIQELEKHKLGSLHELGSILQKNAVNVAVLTESESLQREGVLAVAKACENEHVQFKMVPHFFEILISGLRSEEIDGIQLLGVESLPLTGYRNQVMKRCLDVVGALVGLAISAPLILLFGFLVYRESPGPIFYRQLRQGRSGRLFYIIKIRSMHMNAEAGGKAQWAQANDHRRLQVGAFMRKWNIDEVPQFWNVLIGNMSLVGPRPERPELIARFKYKIPHYQTRHMCQPGITGWAQVNGWRGNTDLEERIRHDIWYLENWSLWLDLRIMLLTFFRRDNAY